ncbi:nicotinate phosphoribosyltransferase [Nesterenkonia sp. E16_7]|uniref:nicotinate phosphoribosyltransferase n=1 Tax=unclassified Nesterenkonia TaxID=2629769 RepID=UPI001A931CDA|nr:nicotinate phosphoribosyltransferase [Nesterenkonia sp. E16_10]MBO0598977.1 nicotinate phosphoribosyltransferase [Nesterenkonia sp. E16_7]
MTPQSASAQPHAARATESASAAAAPAVPATALLTDQYELTMVQAALASGAAGRRCVFEVFTRHLPAGRRYGVVAGTGRMLEGLAAFRFGGAEIDWLRSRGIVDEPTLEFLADYRFSGDIHGYAEGEIFLPDSPVLRVEASFAEACLLETYVLSVLNHDSAIASAASRMTVAAGNRPCVEMGSRRTQEFSAVAAARAAAVAGFTATSNLEAGRRWGLPTLGTAAHAFTLLHDSEEEAFEAQVAAFGPGTTLLVDTYDVETAVRRAASIAGPELGAVRLDSGDLVEQAREVRALLDSLGNTGTRIIVSSDLDEHAIARLQSAPVDSYGVGTKLVTGSGSPTAAMVYKLVARTDDDGASIPVAKNAPGKSSPGGVKHPLRSLDASGRATAELIGVGAAPQTHGQRTRELMVPLVRGGEIAQEHTGEAGVARARDRHAASLAELPPAAKRLQDGDPVLPTIFS